MAFVKLCRTQREGIPIPKIEISLKLDGEDAMRVIRAIVGTETLGKKAEKASKPIKEGKKIGTETLGKKAEKASKPIKEGKKIGRPKGSKNKSKKGPDGEPTKGRPIRLNKVDVLPQHLDLYRLYKSDQPYTAKDAAAIANCTKNVTYGFTRRHGVKWAKVYTSGGNQ